jgi:hypothetical protein
MSKKLIIISVILFFILGLFSVFMALAGMGCGFGCSRLDIVLLYVTLAGFIFGETLVRDTLGTSQGISLILQMIYLVILSMGIPILIKWIFSRIRKNEKENNFN